MPDLPLSGPPAPTPSIRDVIGRTAPPTNDPAWQPPRDPLADVNVQDQLRVISREVPLTVVSTGWDVPRARLAMQSLVIGMFDAPAQLADSVMMSDSRVQAGMASRLAILGRPVDFKLPRKYRDSDAAKECREAFIDAWPTMCPEPVMSEMQRWAIMMGFGVSQILWDTAGEYAIPHPLPWHPRYVYYHWGARCYVAVTLDGQEAIIPGDAHWILHAPHGAYRGWMRGAVPAITPWWLARHYALRDMARYSERHGIPMIKLKTPAVGDPTQQAVIRAQVARLGQEAVFHLPQNPPPALSYDVELMEAKDTSYEGFSLLINQCNMEITLALQAQNLTSEMKEGSFAAARVHADVRQSLLEGDARALAYTVYMQLARPFAAMNFGNADLAPQIVWNVDPYEDKLTAAQTFTQIAQGLAALRNSGVVLKDAGRFFRSLGIDVGKLGDVPLPVESGADASGKAAVAAAKETAKQQVKSNEQAAREGAYRIAPQTGARIAIPDESEELHEMRAWAEMRAEQEAEAARRPAGRARR